MVEEPPNVARFLAAMGEPTELPRRSPGRGPPYWKAASCAARRSVSTGLAASGGVLYFRSRSVSIRAESAAGC